MSMWQDRYKDARLVYETGRYGEALSLIETLAKNDPNNWKLASLCARASLGLTDIGAAKNWLHQLSKTNAPEIVVVNLRAQIAKASDDRSSEIMALRRLQVLKPENPKSLRRLMTLLRPEEDYVEFFDSLKIYLGLEASPNFPPRRFFPYLEAIGPAEFLRQTEPIISVFPMQAALRLARLKAYIESNEMKGAWQEVEALYSVDPNINKPRSIMLTLSDSLACGPEYHPVIQRLHKAHPRSSELLWLYAGVLRSFASIDEYKSLICDNWDWLKAANPSQRDIIVASSLLGPNAVPKVANRRTQFFNFLLADMLPEAADLAPTVEEEATIKEILDIRGDCPSCVPEGSFIEPCRIVGLERENGIVMAFGGLEDKFGLPATALDHVFAKLGLTAIYIKDFSRLLHLNGVEGLGETYEDTIEALARRIKEVSKKAKPLYTFGVSSGSLAAMIYGAELGASASLVFSPPASLGDEAREYTQENRSPHIYRRLRNMIDTDRFELDTLFKKAKPDYHVIGYVPSGIDVDCRHAELLDRLPNTTINYLDACKYHNTLPVVGARYGLLETIRSSFKL